MQRVLVNSNLELHVLHHNDREFSELETTYCSRSSTCETPETHYSSLREVIIVEMCEGSWGQGRGNGVIVY
jgi:hypothetical protein